ncbi:hypothetical protein BU17DRAFT_84987 [Hysterangium stoloniferum]|nr:hypothetical protein BU17DRAFT_84987 [Hysterangium stoloniferum]
MTLVTLTRKYFLFLSTTYPTPVMLNLTALRKVLFSVISPPRLHTAILFTPSGDLVAHSSSNNTRSKDQLRVLVGVATEIWLETSDEGIGMVESELGKIIVIPLHREPNAPRGRVGRSTSRSPSSASSAPAANYSEPPFLVALNAQDDVEWAEMQIKARGVVNHLAAPLLEFGDRLSPPQPQPRTIPRVLDRFY